MRRILLAALIASSALAAQPASADDTYRPDVVGCALENRIGFPYGGYDIDPVRTVLCLRG